MIIAASRGSGSAASLIRYAQFKARSAHGFANETARDGGDVRRMAHNPEVRVQIPPPLPRPEALSQQRKGLLHVVVHGFVHGRLLKPFCSSHAPSPSDLHRGERAADDQLRQGGSDLSAGFQVGLDILLHGERDIRVSDPLTQRLPVDLGIAARGGVAVPDVVQVDLWQSGRRSELLESPRDRVRMRWRPSSQQNSTP
jgi:hypothetical protein